MKQAELKPRKCKACRTKFVPDRPFVVWCSPECGHTLALAKILRAQELKEKRERKELKQAKERIKSRGDFVRDAQTAFNAFIRARDAGKPCISCGRHHQGQNHAGHYRATSVAPALRFHESNVHLQCQPCNTHLHGNLIEYRIRLIERIGREAVEWLESNHPPAKYSIDDLKEIKSTYSRKARDLLKGVE